MRSTLIVLISIPLSILTSIVVLFFLGDTLNTMTLGGMALAVGLLVDDSTVTIENTHRLRGEGMSRRGGDAARLRRHRDPRHGLDACGQLRVHLGGVPRRASHLVLFTPLEARGSCSPCWPAPRSRTLTPVINGILLKGERHGEGSEGWFARFHAGFDRGFERFRRGYVRVLAILFKRWFIVPVIAALMLALGGVMLTVVGRDFFPAIDGGQIKLHVRAPARVSPSWKLPRASFRMSRTKSAKSFRPAIATSSSTISGCRNDLTTSPSPTARPSTSTTA